MGTDQPRIIRFINAVLPWVNSHFLLLCLALLVVVLVPRLKRPTSTNPKVRALTVKIGPLLGYAKGAERFVKWARDDQATGAVITIRLPDHHISTLAKTTTVQELIHRLAGGDWTCEQDVLHDRLRFTRAAPTGQLPTFWPYPADNGLPAHLVPFAVDANQNVILADMRSEAPHVLIGGGTGKGKALAIDTPIPTPAGWTTMGELRVGDEVFDETGTICRVLFATDVMHGHACFDVGFSDGSVITADGDHQWLTHARRARRGRGVASVVTTTEIAATLVTSTGHTNHSIPVTGALNLPDAYLPVDPYVLGVWLGDGTSSGTTVTAAEADMAEMMPAVVDGGYAVTRYQTGIRCPTWQLTKNGTRYKQNGLRNDLRELGVLGNKHIPAAYLRASHEQRTALLQGLMDTDGYCSKIGQAVFGVTDPRLATDVLALIITLGHKATMTQRPAPMGRPGRRVAYEIKFTPTTPVFGLTRKLERQHGWARAYSTHRFITSVTPRPSTPVRCIQVSSPSHLFLAGHSMIATHNTSTLSVFIAHIAGRGGLVTICDPKMTGFIKAFRGLGNIHVVHEIEDMTAAVREFHDDMRSRYAAEEAGADITDHAAYPTRVLVIDEMGSFTAMVTEDWADRRDPKVDPTRPPAVAQLSRILWQGRHARCHVVMSAQQANAAVIGSTDKREQFAMRIGCGAPGTRGGALLFGTDDLPAVDPKVKGRGLASLEGADPVAVQLAYLDTEQARAIASEGLVTFADYDARLVTVPDDAPPVPVDAPRTPVALTCGRCTNVWTSTAKAGSSVKCPECKLSCRIPVTARS